jgi:hypothetical protein
VQGKGLILNASQPPPVPAFRDCPKNEQPAAPFFAENTRLTPPEAHCSRHPATVLGDGQNRPAGVLGADINFQRYFQSEGRI